MKAKSSALIWLLFVAVPVYAHRLDEYLQAVIVSIEPDQIRASVRLAPGAAVASKVIATVDADGDGILSVGEQRAYAEAVLRELSLSVDGHRLQPLLEVVDFPTTNDIRDGIGEMHIEFRTEMRFGDGSQRTVIVENHYEPQISVYLMNCTLPKDDKIQVTSQSRNPNQSYYRVDYAQKNVTPLSSRTDLNSALFAFGGVPNMFRLGMGHIAEGTDHLLFLLVLLLPAPLLTTGARWASYSGIRHSLRQILGIVTAFTIGHSVTLALAALGIVSLPSRPVEVLIAFSILISAVHALRPIFPGREAMVAGGFGLIHGLAFATTLENLGVETWQRIASILGFNLGIEAMQLIVVAAILPSLLVLSREPSYTVLRVAGALFAVVASLAWIGERLFNIPTFVSAIVDAAASRSAWVAAVLAVISMVIWIRSSNRGAQVQQTKLQIN